MNEFHEMTDKKAVNLTVNNQETLLAFIDKLSLCPNVTVNIIVQNIGNITSSTVSLVNASGGGMKIDCKAKRGILR